MQPPNQQSCPKPPKTVQNKPCSTQKPTPEVSQDVGLSVEHLVGPALSHSNLWDECWRYVMQHAPEEVRQLQQAQQRMAANEGAVPEEAAAGASRRLTRSGAEAAGRTEPGDAKPVRQAETSTTTPSDGATKPTGPAPRRINRRLRPEVAREMVQLHRSGHTVKEIAQQFGFHRETVATHLKRAGLTLRTSLTDEAFCQRVRQTYETIGTVKDTAQQLGVSKDTVRKVLRG